VVFVHDFQFSSIIFPPSSIFHLSLTFCHFIKMTFRRFRHVWTFFAELSIFQKTKKTAVVFFCPLFPFILASRKLSLLSTEFLIFMDRGLPWWNDGL